MVDVPREDDRAALRTVVPEWLTRPPEVELLRREAARVRAAEEAELRQVDRGRWRGAALTGAGILASGAVALCLLANETPSPTGVLVALLIGALAGAVARALGDGAYVWGTVMAVAGFALALFDGGLLTLIFLPPLCGTFAILAGFGRDPSFRIR